MTLTGEAEQIWVQVRLQSGHTQTLELPRPRTLGEQRRTAPTIVDQIDTLLEDFTDAGIAQVLNASGLHPVEGEAFTLSSIRYLRQAHHLRSRWERLRDRGWLTQTEVAAMLQIGIATIKAWRQQGLLRAAAYNDKPEYLYAPLTYPIPRKGQRKQGWASAHPVDPQKEKEV